MSVGWEVFSTPKPKFTRPKLLLHPNIPKPMHGVNPRSVLGRKWWDEKRQEAYEKNNYCCWACGIHKSRAKYVRRLEAHESYEINYKKGTMKLKEIAALCHSCHSYIHSGRLTMLYQSGKITEEKYRDIIDRGNSILSSSNLKPNDDSPESVAEWSKWRLIIDGKKYGPKFKNYEEWKKEYEIE